MTIADSAGTAGLGAQTGQAPSSRPSSLLTSRSSARWRHVEGGSPVPRPPGAPGCDARQVTVPWIPRQTERPVHQGLWGSGGTARGSLCGARAEPGLTQVSASKYSSRQHSAGPDVRAVTTGRPGAWNPAGSKAKKCAFPSGRRSDSVGEASDFGSGHDLTVPEFEPRVGLCADSSEPGACFRFCVSLSLTLPCSCSVSPCLKNK